MSFKDVIGHKTIVAQLKNAVSGGRVGNAYLFSGPAGIGKKTVAAQFAKALNCLNGDPDGCDACESCRKTDASTHPDVKWFGPAGASRSIKIESVRELIRNASMKPYEARRKVFILAEAETLNPASGNALLKTLEEPPGDTVFILTTAHKDALLPTICSRCQTVDFQPLSLKIMEGLARSRHALPEREAGLYAAMSGGRIGRLDLLMKGDYFRRRDSIIGALADGRFATVSAVVPFVEALIDDLKSARKADEAGMKEEGSDIGDAEEAYLEGRYKEELYETLQCVYLFYRDLLVHKADGDDSLFINYDKADIIRSVSAAYTPEGVEDAIGLIASIRRAVAGNANLRLALEVLFLKLGKAA